MRYRGVRNRSGFGALSLLALGVILAPGCRPQPAMQSPSFAFDPGHLDQDAAYQEVDRFVGLGPRDSGTEGAERAAAYLAERMESLGLEVRVDKFEDPTPRGPTIFRNVIGVVPGEGEGRILIGGHYDTKSGIDGTFVGANDSGSSTGLLLELARVARASGYGAGPVPDLWFVLFDGEEAMVKYGRQDGFHGSRHLARKLQENDQIADTRAVIILDMIGDRDLGVTLPRGSTPELLRLAFDAAEAEGVRNVFRLHRGDIGDDHVPFLEVGIPAIDLIDFEFGDRPGGNSYWHTDADTMDKISPQSLGIVGRVTLRMLNDLIQDD